MKSTKYLDILHIVMHMSTATKPLTSEDLSKAIKTNPVVVRHIMAGLRERGFATSEKGHGGGWKLTCDLDRVTLFDIYEAIGSPGLLAIGSRDASSDCQVEQAVNKTAGAVLEEAEKQIETRLSSITLRELSNNINSIKGEKYSDN